MIIFNDDKRKAIGPTKNISYYIEDRTLMTDIHSAFARIKLMKFGVAAEQIMCMWLKKRQNINGKCVLYPKCHKICNSYLL